MRTAAPTSRSNSVSSHGRRRAVIALIVAWPPGTSDGGMVTSGTGAETAIAASRRSLMSPTTISASSESVCRNSATSPSRRSSRSATSADSGAEAIMAASFDGGRGGNSLYQVIRHDTANLEPDHRPETRTSPPRPGGLEYLADRDELLEGLGKRLEPGPPDLDAGGLRLGDNELARLERVRPLLAALGGRLLDGLQLDDAGDRDDPGPLLAQLVADHRLQGGD